MTYYINDDSNEEHLLFKTNNIVDFYKYYCLATIDYLDTCEFYDADVDEILHLSKFMSLVNNKKWKLAYDLINSINSKEYGKYIITNPYEGEIYLTNNIATKVKFPKPRIKDFSQKMSEMQKRIVFK